MGLETNVDSDSLHPMGVTIRDRPVSQSSRARSARTFGADWQRNVVAILRRFAIVVSQQPAESFTTDDIAIDKRFEPSCIGKVEV